jgi:hypothetical protein
MAEEKKKIVIDVDVEQGDAIKRIEALESAMFRTQENASEMREEMTEGFKAAGEGAQKASKGVGGFGSTLKGIVGGIGILTLLNKAFEMLKEVVGNNQEAADFLAKAFEAVQIILTKVLNEAVVPLTKFMIQLFTEPQTAIDSFVEALEPVKKFFNDIGDYIKNEFFVTWTKASLAIDEMRLKWNQLTGDTEEAAEIQKKIVDETLELVEYQKEASEAADRVTSAVVDGVKAVVTTVKETVTEAVEAADQIVNLRNASELAEAQLQLQMLATQEEAEIQRQIRDDISRTLADRIEANEKLGKILIDQAESEKKIAQTTVDAVQAEIDAYGANIERTRRLIEAKKELQDIDERITGQKSEQLTNEKALEKELFDFQQELRVLNMTEREKEFEELEIEMERLAEIKRLAGDTEVDIEAEKERRLQEIKDKHRKEDLEAEKKQAEKLKKEQEKVDKAKISAAQNVAGALGAISSAMQAAGMENQAFQKALAVGEIAISAAIATAAAIKNATSSSATVWDMIANIAVAVGTVAGAIASATAILNEAEGPSAPPPPVASAAPSPSVASAAAVMTDGTELGGAQQAQLAPIQAFVVETEMTGNQQNINQIENQVTFGIDG